MHAPSPPDIEGPAAHASPIPAPPSLQVWEAGDIAVFAFDLPAPPVQAAGLSDAESEVVAAALAGWSNAQIARARGRSARTIANQLASAFAKLGVSGRAELGALLARRPDQEEG